MDDAADHLTPAERAHRNKENFLIGLALLAEAEECLEAMAMRVGAADEPPIGAGGLAEESKPVMIMLGPGVEVAALALVGRLPGSERPKDVTPETHAYNMAMLGARGRGQFPRKNWLMAGANLERRQRDPHWDKLLCAMGDNGSSILVCAAHQLYHEFGSAGQRGADARQAILLTVPKLKRSIGDLTGDAKAVVVALKHVVTQSCARAFDMHGYRLVVNELINRDVSTKPAVHDALAAIPDLERDGTGYEKLVMGSASFMAVGLAREALAKHLEGDDRKAVAAAMQAAVSIYKPAESLAVLGVMGSCYGSLSVRA